MILTFFFVFTATACGSSNLLDNNGDQLLIGYKEFGGMDMYQDGDQYGFVLSIFESGIAKLNYLIVDEQDGRSKVIEKPAGRLTLSQVMLDSTIELLTDEQIKSALKIATDINWNEQLIREPSVTISLKISDSLYEAEKEYQLFLGAIQGDTWEEIMSLIEHFRKIKESAEVNGVN